MVACKRRFGGRRFFKPKEMTTEQIQERKQQGSQRVKPVWIKASEVFILTIWKDRNALMRAKKAGHITMKRDNGIWYRIDNVHPIFILKQTA